MEEEKDLTPQIFLSNEKFEIPEEGMLGLLALGDVGLKMWRQKRESIKASIQSSGNTVTDKSVDQKTTDTGLTTTD